MFRISKFNKSLYLDIYIQGKSQYEYLKLYLIPERTIHDSNLNNQTLRIARATKAKRLIEVRSEFYTLSSISSKCSKPVSKVYYSFQECQKTVPKKWRK